MDQAENPADAYQEEDQPQEEDMDEAPPEQEEPQEDQQDDQRDDQQDSQQEDQQENCEQDQYELDEDPQDEQMGDQPGEQQDEHDEHLDGDHDESMGEPPEDPVPEADREMQPENEEQDQAERGTGDETGEPKGDQEDVDEAEQEQDRELDLDDGNPDAAEPESKESYPGRCEVDLDDSERDPAEDAEAPEWDGKEEVEQPYVECEEDAPEDGRIRVEPGTFAVSSLHSTLNVMTTDGKLLLPVSDRGFQHLVAAARATAGLRNGRYLFEVRIVELRRSVESGKHRVPRQFCGIGFCADGSSLFLGHDEECMGFDSEGCLCKDGRKSWMDGLNDRIKLDRQVVMGVLLNLDAKSPNANTLSLFVNGERFGRPQSLPENLKGKPLYPLINFKNAACLSIETSL